MTYYDQNSQNVNKQYNAVGDINITNPVSASKRKAEISKEISHVKTEMIPVEVEVEKLKSELWGIMFFYLPANLSTELLLNSEKIIEDEMLMLQVQLESMRRGPDGKAEAIKALRDKYKRKNSELKSRKEHLNALENELKYLSYKDVVTDIASAIKSFLE
ncbi:hypothetical protein [Aerosakkonema funiforme]|uniref:Uncharacterized protein n=1 Tax=Aerosakkonema funiforme FACHB-1375 TaxID=2949571 RepID=A0A926ZGU0_9CYAN|nr:hypothetical protein [Aerosakkonema funiforme]MBD2181929.1 hypothetical protein [Aerosakkonema funiforme FACHB-1375]